LRFLTGAQVATSSHAGVCQFSRRRRFAMAVQVQTTSPLPSPWAWRSDESAFGYGFTMSPTLRGERIDDNQSFLAPLNSYRLEDEAAPPPSTPAVRREPSSGADVVEMFVQEAFDEMDSVLEQRRSSGEHGSTAVAGSSSRRDAHHAPPLLHHLDARPSAEEQAWLDEQFEMDEDASRMADSDDYFWEDDDAEEEGAYVRRLLALHPALDEEEARWLYQRERSQRHEAMAPG